MTTKKDTEVLWYIVHTYSSQEERVKKNLDLRIETMDMRDKILQVVVPMEQEIEIKKGKRVAVPRRAFPGYVMVQMKMEDESWHVVRNTPGVTGFVSAEDDQENRPKPVPLDEHEVKHILEQADVSKARVTVGFESGQMVRITEGPFLDFMGVIDEVHLDRSKVKVLVTFFGRETPVEVDFLQVEKL